MPKRTMKRKNIRKKKSRKRRKINTRRKRLLKKKVGGANPLSGIMGFLRGDKTEQPVQPEKKVVEKKNEKCECNNDNRGFLDKLEGFFVKQKTDADSALELLKSKDRN